ncbi:MAG: septum formation inhibitor Maf, partial [Comamonas sp.]
MSESTPLQRPLILGSTSRYRKELVQRLNIPFSTHSP